MAPTTVAQNRPRYPLELLYVKALFLDKQYRRCAQACHSLIIAGSESWAQNELQLAFLNFYEAMSYDELARLMHDYSHTKLPAIQEAEELYFASLRYLSMFSTSEETNSTSESCTLGRRNSLPCVTPKGAETMESEMYSEHYSYALIVHHQLDDSDSIPTPTQAREAVTSIATTLTTPSRLQKSRTMALPRDFSNISLVDVAPNCALSRSATQTLLKPIRLGSPPKPYSAYTRPVGTTPQPSRFPASTGSPVSRQQAGCSHTHHAYTPVGPPIPEEPAAQTTEPMHMPSETSSCISVKMNGNGDTHLATHLAAMRIQILTHLSQLARLRETVMRSQQRRRGMAVSSPTARPLPAVRTPNTKACDRRTGKPGYGVPTARSFWSFTPDDVRAANLQERIEHGRERGWTRERWRPDRYRTLADAALSEL